MNRLTRSIEWLQQLSPRAVPSWRDINLEFNRCVCWPTAASRYLASMRRSTCGAQLEILTGQLAQMCRLAGSGMERATRALLTADLHLAERVIGDHADVASAKADVEATGFVLLARHAPLARDLRTTIGCLQIVAEIDRMSVLALHVAETVRRRHPRSVLPWEIGAHFADMGRIATDLADNAYQVISTCDLGRARYIREADAAMDRLHRELFTVTIDREWSHGAAAAVDVTLLGRYYERFADHAVEIARRVIFQATGQLADDDADSGPLSGPHRSVGAISQRL